MAQDTEASSSNAPAEQFTPARARRKRKGRGSHAPPPPEALYEQTAAELARTAWLRDSIRLVQDAAGALPSAESLSLTALCLGLGSPGASPDARTQLAFLIALCDALSIARASISIFDPVFTPADEQLLASLGLTRLRENKRASHALGGPCVVFMPHCDVQLYENLLRENWTRARLPNLLLIANRLSEYADSTPARRLALETPCVARLAPRLATRDLPACAAYPTAFNNTTVQSVGADGLPWPDAPAPTGEEASSPPPFWELPPRAVDAHSATSDVL